jgi:hypothetical protein
MLDFRLADNPLEVPATVPGTQFRGPRIATVRSSTIDHQYRHRLNHNPSGADLSLNGREFREGQSTDGKSCVRIKFHVG